MNYYSQLFKINYIIKSKTNSVKTSVCRKSCLPSWHCERELSEPSKKKFVAVTRNARRPPAPRLPLGPVSGASKKRSFYVFVAHRTIALSECLHSFIKKLVHTLNHYVHKQNCHYELKSCIIAYPVNFIKVLVYDI